MRNTRYNSKRVLYYAIFLSTITLFTSTHALSNKNFRFTILHTNDLHSHFEGSGPDAYFTAETGDHDPVAGHYARLKEAIEKERVSKAKKGEPTLLFDAGDFYSGTLFHGLGPVPTNPSTPELEFFSDAKYDAVTFGNHEFDAGEDGLATMLAKARVQKFSVPFVLSNVEHVGGPLSPFLNEKADQGSVFIKKTLVKELQFQGSTLRVGVLGLLGPDAALVSAGTRNSIRFAGFDDSKMKLRIKDFVKSAAEATASLKGSAKADVVVAIMHAGSPEDEEVAKAVKDIDVIISGHTHQKYTKKVGHTILSQTGCYGSHLGVLELQFDGMDVTLANDKTSIAIDDTLSASPEWLKRIANFKTLIDVQLKPTGFAYTTPITKVTESVKRTREHNDKLGRLVTTGILDALNTHLATPVDVYFTSLSLIRETFTRSTEDPTQYQLSDVFRMLSIGFDNEFNPGSPIVDFYLTPAEVDRLMEFMELYRHISANFTPAFSGNVSSTLRWWGIPFVNRVGNIRVSGEPLRDRQRLVHVATNTFVARYFDKLDKLTYGLVKIQPRNERGEPIHPLSRTTNYKEYLLLAENLREKGLSSSKN